MPAHTRTAVTLIDNCTRGLTPIDSCLHHHYLSRLRTSILVACHMVWASYQIEIGGDGHSTINTEATHWPRGPPTTPDFTRGWEMWFAAEAKKRNLHIRIVALPWSFPYWFPKAGLGDAAGVAYYVGTKRKR